MTIINSEIVNKKLIIKLDLQVTVLKIYLDNISNEKNKFSENDNDHTKVILQDGSKLDITIDIADLNETALIVTVVSDTNATSLALDNEAIYLAKINQLLYFCNTCLDKLQKYNIVLIELRNNLLQYAIEHHLLTDAIQHYKELDLLLNIQTCNNNCCEDGCCSL